MVTREECAVAAYLMTALDLTLAPPRSAREQLAGYCFLPRTIDKARALLPGGAIGAYHMEGASADLLAALGIRTDEFCAAVGQAVSEADLLAWIQAHGDCTNAERFNAGKLGARIGDVLPHQAAGFRAEHPALSSDEIDRFVDALDADDSRCFTTFASGL